MVATVFPNLRFGKLSVQLTKFVERAWGQRQYRWFDFTYGRVLAIYEAGDSFEVEPGYGLFEYKPQSGTVGGEVTIFVTSFAFDDLQVGELDIARDAYLAGRWIEGARIARGAVPHGWPLIVALFQREARLEVDSS
jgi:hypothetical protein